jgi:hypothetical protein
LCQDPGVFHRPVQARIALVHDSDLFLSAGFERCEFHWITPCFSMKYMIKKNIDKQA